MDWNPSRRPYQRANELVRASGQVGSNESSCPGGRRRLLWIGTRRWLVAGPFSLRRCALVDRRGLARRVEGDACAFVVERVVDCLDEANDLEPERARRPRGCSRADRGAEVPQLEEERLCRIDVRRDDVAGAVAQVVLAEAR